MKKFLRSIDNLGYKIRFFHKSEMAYHTNISIFTSLLVYFVSFYFIYYFSRDMILQTNPRINFIEKEFDDIVQVNFESFIKSINIVVDASMAINKKKSETASTEKNEKSKVKMSSYLLSQNVSLAEIICLQINISTVLNEKTEQSDLFSFNQEIHTIYFTNEPSDFLFTEEESRFTFNKTIDKKSTFNLKVFKRENSFSDKEGEKEIEVFKEEWSYNKNLSEYWVNLTKNSLIEFILVINYDLLKEKNLNLNVMKFDRMFETSDFEIDPKSTNFFHFLSHFKVSLSSKKPTKISQRFYKYGLYEISDYKNFIFSEPDVKIAFNKQKVTISDEKVSKNRKIKFITLYFDGIKKFYSRVYKNLLDVLSDLGGIFKAMVLFGKLIVSVINRKFFDHDAVNYVFKLEKEEKASDINSELTNKLNFNDNCNDNFLKKINGVSKNNKSSIKNIKFNQNSNLYYKDNYKGFDYKNNRDFNNQPRTSQDKLDLLYKKQVVVNDLNLFKPNRIDNLREIIPDSMKDLNQKENRIETNRMIENDFSNKDSGSDLNLNSRRELINEESSKIQLNQNESINKSKIFEENLLQPSNPFDKERQKHIELSNTGQTKTRLNQTGKNSVLIDTINNNNDNISKKFALNIEKNKSDEDRSKIKNNSDNYFDCNSKPKNFEEQTKFNDSVLIQKIRNLIKNKLSKGNDLDLDIEGKEGKHKNEFRMSFSEILKTFLCCSKFKTPELIKKEKLYEKAEIKILDYLNVLNYFDIYEDLEKIKNIIFNENQNVLFHFLNKRSFNDIANVDIENRLFRSVKFYRMNKHKITNKFDRDLIDNSKKEIRELIES